MAPVPDLYPSRLLIFLPNAAQSEGSEWKAIRVALHQFFLDQGAESYKKRLDRLPRLLAGDWASPKLSDLDDVSLVQRYVSKCMFFMLLGEWITDDEGAMLGRWRGYAEEFILPRLIHRFKFNLGIRKVKTLREQTVGLVEKYGKQELFVRVNDSLGPWRRDSAVCLCDELMYALGFAGIGGVCAATESVGAFLQAKLPAESPGKKYIHWGEYDTSEKMVAKFNLDPERYIRETCRLDPPVTSATSALGEATKVTLARKEFLLPGGTLNQYALSVANRDDVLFPNASTFNPDRDNLEKALTWNGAFGASNEASYPRICPGRHLSLEITKAMVQHAMEPSDTIAAPTAEIVGVRSVEEGAAAGPEGGSEAAATAEIVGVENMEEGAAAAAPAVASRDGRQAAPTADSAETGNDEEQQTVVCCQLV